MASAKLLTLAVFILSTNLLAHSAWSPRIVYGVGANIKNHPYQVSLEIDGRHVCGGSIIDPSAVLTAAHCVEELSVERMAIRAGSSIRERGGQVATVVAKFIHSNWNDPFFNNDVAVLELRKPLDLNDKVRLIRISRCDCVPDGGVATVTGWGLTQNLTLATVLQKLLVFKSTEAECRNRFSNLFNSKTMVCYKGGQGGMTCSSDSGGPLVYNGVQVGVVSFGLVPCNKASPDIYARVEVFFDFVQGHLATITKKCVQ